MFKGQPSTNRPSEKFLQYMQKNQQQAKNTSLNSLTLHLVKLLTDAIQPKLLLLFFFTSTTLRILHIIKTRRDKSRLFLCFHHLFDIMTPFFKNICLPTQTGNSAFMLRSDYHAHVLNTQILERY